MPDLHGVGFRGGIFGYLIDTTLAKNTQYDCLSYTWGTGPYEHSIRMGDHRICIPRNLYTALRCLQLKDEPRLVWVDFFCINQEDAEERQTQVEMMYQIYQGAREVVVDLGHASEGSENLPGLFEDIIVAAAEEYGIHVKPRTPNALAGRARLPPSTSDIWHAFKSFLERPWFTRVWIIQEVIAAKKFIVICGGWTIAGGTLFTVLEVAIEWQLPCCFRRRHSLSDRPDKHRLIGLLERSRHARSTDPRDRAFAFLNLCREQERQSLRPDYTETVAETYTRIARFFVSQGEASRLLCNAFLSDSTLQLPTWIPDWS
ncbi:HET-domain-containing protein, partial [Stipitochalara longipes BDJ]